MYKLPVEQASASPRQVLEKLISHVNCCGVWFDRAYLAKQRGVFDKYWPGPGQIILLQEKEIRERLKELESKDVESYDLIQFYDQWIGKGIGAHVKRKTSYGFQ